VGVKKLVDEVCQLLYIAKHYGEKTSRGKRAISAVIGAIASYFAKRGEKTPCVSYYLLIFQLVLPSS